MMTEMNHRKLMGEYYKDDGSVAKLYQVINGMDGEHSFFSITYKDATGIRMTTEDFKYKSLSYVEDAAENWQRGIKQLLTE
tara:strand:- start:29 stop:271 length:243 start_codon:yes stop_codon:yes gene_type:complete